MIVRRASLAAAVTLIALLAQHPPAEAGFAPENDTIVSTPFPELSGVATDPNGNSLVVWAQPTTALGPPYVPRARWLSVAGDVGPVIDLSPGGTGFEPKVAMAPSGRAFVAWRIAGETGPVGAAGRAVEPDGSLGQLDTFAPPAVGELNVAELEVVVDPAGVATVGVRNQASGYSQELAMQRIQPDGAAGPLITKVGTGVIEMEMAALPNGSTEAVWRGLGIEEAVLTGSLEVVPAVNLASSSNSVFGPGIAVDSLGHGMVAWRKGNAPPFSVRGRLLGRSGDPLGEELVLEGDASGNLGTPLHVAADTADDFAVAWTRQEGLNSALAKARTVSSSGALTGPVQTLSASGAYAEQPVPVLSDRGGGAVVWDRFEGMSTPVAQGRTIDAAGSPTSDIAQLFGPGSQLILASSAPAIGYAVFAIGHRDTVVARRFMEPPSCSDSTARVRQGKPITIHLACAGLAIDHIDVLSPTAHGGLGPSDPAGLTVRYRPKPGFAGSDGFTFATGNDGGASNAARVSIRVGKDTIRPKIKRLRFVRKKKRMKFVVKVSEQAAVRIVVERSAKRRRRVVVGKLKSRKPKRKAVIKVKGRLARRLLLGGRFRATAVATDPARNKSRPKILGLSVKR